MKVELSAYERAVNELNKLPLAQDRIFSAALEELRKQRDEALAKRASAIDAITELRRLRSRFADGSRPGHRSVNRVFLLYALDARIAELEAQQHRPGCTMTKQLVGDGCDLCNQEAQQAEPSDAEIEAWHGRMHDAMLSMNHAWDLPDAMSCKPFGEHAKHAAARKCIKEAVALMRRGRGDQRLREAAKRMWEACHANIIGVDVNAMPHGNLAGFPIDRREDAKKFVALLNELRAALGEQ